MKEKIKVFIHKAESLNLVIESHLKEEFYKYEIGVNNNYFLKEFLELFIKHNFRQSYAVFHEFTHNKTIIQKDFSNANLSYNIYYDSNKDPIFFVKIININTFYLVSKHIIDVVNVGLNAFLLMTHNEQLENLLQQKRNLQELDLYGCLNYSETFLNLSETGITLYTKSNNLKDVKKLIKLIPPEVEIDYFNSVVDE